ncbi:MAG: SCP2 sterol-binding domain-containing protein, partial [Myxococcota bacterium]
ERGPSQDENVPPERDPDTVVEEVIPEQQALLYRLSGDWNPLHADPNFAKAVGYNRPILHGLCTFGYATRHVIQSHAPDGDSDFFKSIKVRFADVVYPGETLRTEMWKESDNRIVFRCRIKERDSLVITHAAIELYSEVPKPAAKPAAKAEASAPAKPISADIFAAIGQYIADNPELAAKVKTVFAFELSAPDSAWTIDLVAGEVKQGKGKAQCTLALSDGDFMDMATGKADPMKLFSSGKLRISGDVMASQKLDFLKQITADMVVAQMDKRLAGGSPSAGSAGAAETAAEATSWDVFIAIRDHIERNSELVAKVGIVFQFKLHEPDSVWTVNLRDGSGSVDRGETVKPECTLEITEADFLAMTRGEADPMKLFTGGKLRISGNVMASQKLDFLQKIDPEQARAAVAKARAAGGPEAEAAPSASAAAQTQAPAIFAALTERLAAKPELAGEVAAVIQFDLADPRSVTTPGAPAPEHSWVVDMSGATPSVREGRADDPATTFTLKDEALVALVSGETSAQHLYQHGEIRIDGDVAVAQRLGFMKGLI